MRKPGFEPGSQPWQGRILTTGPLAQKSKANCIFYKCYWGLALLKSSRFARVAISSHCEMFIDKPNVDKCSEHFRSPRKSMIFVVPIVEQIHRICEMSKIANVTNKYDFRAPENLQFSLFENIAFSNHRRKFMEFSEFRKT